MELESLRELYIDELKDLYSAEKQLVKALPKMVKNATNPDLKNTRETQIAVRGAVVRSVKGTSLTARDMHAHNSFADPNQVQPKAIAVSLTGSALIYAFPPASVTRLDLELV